MESHKCKQEVKNKRIKIGQQELYIFSYKKTTNRFGSSPIYIVTVDHPMYKKPTTVNNFLLPERIRGEMMFNEMKI